MEIHGLSQHLSRIEFFLEDQQQISLDDNDYLNQESYSVQEGEEPELHLYPFDFEKEEEPTQDKTTEAQSITEHLHPPSSSSIQFSPQYLPCYHKIFIGTKDDTVQLSTNFKTILVAHFRELIHLKELSPQECRLVEQFAERVPSFASLKIFYQDTKGNQGLRARCLSFWESSECISKIMRGRSRLKTKLTMVKYIQKMRSNLLDNKILKWKDKVSWKLTTD